MKKIDFDDFIKNIKPYFVKYKESIEGDIKKNKKQNLYLLRGEAVLKLKVNKRTDSFNITHVFPLCYGYQVPIFFDIKKKTMNNIFSYQIIDDVNTPNKIIKFEIGPKKKGESFTIHFEYYVLVKNHTYKDLSSNIKIPNLKEIPEHNRTWLVSTNSIQCKNIFIRVKALLLKRFTKNLTKLGEKIVFSSCYHRPLLGFIRYHIELNPILRRLFLPNSYWTGLSDAVSCFFFGGLCEGKANYETALFRANHIPARVLITTTLFYGKDLWMDSQHYITEFYSPDYGWIPAMSGRLLYQPKNYIILRIIYPHEENIAGNGLSFYGGAATWFWIPSDKIELSFPNKLIDYGYKKGPGVPANRGWCEKRIKVDGKIAKKAFDLSKKVWELYLTQLNNKNKIKSIIDNARLEQKKGIQHFNQSNVNKYIECMNNVLRIIEK